ncbi:hypothetical protein RIR_jg37062.t1 [Rhizophagus irregularis DAOM 181602=DAOM 197198]|nr:hypothetical protein RIR_jg37062.t1 [Rhizophagus irregularis DAOM 181602=DAOM 197198]
MMHNTTAEKTPFYLTYGREATLPIDLKIPSQISQKQAKNLDGKLVKHVIHGNRLKKYHEQKLEPIVII